jgi:glycosyltransferase involved in cell wall biosynthesis
MRVLALCDYYDESGVGGAEIAAREIYTRLARDYSVEVTVVGGLPRRQWKLSPGSVEGGVQRMSVPGHDLTGVLGAQMMVSPSLGRAAWAEARKLLPDLVHINGLHFQSTGVGIRLSRMLAVPVVSTAHLADVAAMPGPTSLAATAFDRVWAGRAARLSNRVVAVSKPVSDHLVHLGVDPARIDIAHNGVDRGRFRPAGAKVRSAELRAVVVGRLTPNKGTAHALEAVAAARASGRDVRLVVVGDGPLEARLRRQAAEPRLAGAVTFVGRVANVAPWLADADVALRPSYTEGLPLAVIEALACGTPVVCSAVPGNLELVRHGSNGLVVPIGDVSALSHALVSLYDNRRALGHMSAEAVRSAGAFSWTTSAGTHLAAFESALSLKRLSLQKVMAA